MGNWCSRCHPTFHLTSQIGRSRYFGDSESLVEFDTLMDQQPHKRPLSMVASHEKELIQAHQQYQALEETVQQDSEILVQFVQEEEELELQEESASEAQREALRIKKLAENAEIMNPAKLAFDNSALWLGEDASHWNVAGQEYISSPGKQHESRHHNGHIETAKQDKLLTGLSTPQSSVDLEWENEEGLSPPTHVPDDDDDDLVSDTASCLSQLSTPLSNGNEELEWDGHFTRLYTMYSPNRTHISQLDIETERLISEIERMTSDALNSASQQR